MHGLMRLLSACSGKGLVEELEALYGKVRQQAGRLLAVLAMMDRLKEL